MFRKKHEVVVRSHPSSTKPLSGFFQSRVDRRSTLAILRNRLAACAIAGVEPRFASFEGDDEFRRKQSTEPCQGRERVCRSFRG